MKNINTTKKYIATLSFIFLALFTSFGSIQIVRAADAIDTASSPGFQIVPDCKPRRDGSGKITNLVATSESTNSGRPEYECGYSDLLALLQNIISFLLYSAFTLAVIVTAYAGFEYMTSAGSTEKISHAHAMFKKAATGMFIAFTAWLIVDLILKTLLDTNSYNSGEYSLLQKNK